MISIISPLFNESATLIELYKRLTNVLSGLDEYELIFVDNGSSDDTHDLLRNLNISDKHVKFIRLTRNFGHQGGLWAGMSFATGDAVVTIDGDLQHPPELIADLVQEWKKGFKVINGVKSTENDPRNWKKICSIFFYWLIGSITPLRLTYGQSDFRLLDREVVDFLQGLPEKEKFLRGLVSWSGFSDSSIIYKPDKRKSGRSRFGFTHYFNLALTGIFSFSTTPLRFMLITGISIAILSLAYGIYLIYLVFPIYWGASVQLPPGWVTLTVSILFLSSVQLISLGVIGEYMARVVLNTAQRPDFIVSENRGFGNEVGD